MNPVMAASVTKPYPYRAGAYRHLAGPVASGRRKACSVMPSKSITNAFLRNVKPPRKADHPNQVAYSTRSNAVSPSFKNL